MFETGDILSLRLKPCDETIDVRIHSMPTEFTMSATMVVDVLSQPSSPGHSLPSRVFLKLYDRRFADACRDVHGLGEWSPEIESEILELSRTKAAAAEDVLKRYLESTSKEDFGEELTVTETEVWLWENLRNDCKLEREAYEALREHQGGLIPKFYSKVEYSIPIQDGGSPGLSPELFTTYGILIEYIDGFRLSDFLEHIDLSQWEQFVHRARQATEDVFKSSRVTNEDVRPDNMMVTRDDDADGGYRFVMVDLGQCEVHENRSEETSRTYAREQGQSMVRGMEPPHWYHATYCNLHPQELEGKPCT